jgi:hypothetical protein
MWGYDHTIAQGCSNLNLHLKLHNISGVEPCQYTSCLTSLINHILFSGCLLVNEAEIKFRCNSWTRKMDSTSSSERSVNIQQFSLCHITGDLNLRHSCPHLFYPFCSSPYLVCCVTPYRLTLVFPVLLNLITILDNLLPSINFM